MTASQSPSPAGRLGGFGSVLAFLSIIPMHGRQTPTPEGAADATASATTAGGLYSAARNMHLFPLAGILLGLGTGLLAWGLFEAVGQPLLAGLLAAAAILVVTGLHHTDGLADLADGLMTRGSRRRRLDAMKDKSTGTAGTVAVVLCIAGLVITLSMSGGGLNVMIGIILAEMLAKFSMVVMAAVGRPATHNTGAVFTSAMKDGGRIIAASAIVIITFAALAAAAAGTAGAEPAGLSWEPALAMVAVAVLIPLILTGIASRSFGGVTGDVFGAANDLVRVASLAVFFSA